MEILIPDFFAASTSWCMFHLWSQPSKRTNDLFQGIKFEPNSFKLNHEMVVLMGGRLSQGYNLFQQSTIKAFLAIRPHVDQIVSTVDLMLGTGLPSFKGEATIKRLRERFVPAFNERQAAEWMVGIVKNAHENIRSTAYDEFQRVCASSLCLKVMLTLLYAVAKWCVSQVAF